MVSARLTSQRFLSNILSWDGSCSADKIKEFAPLGVKGFVLGTSLLFGKGRPYGDILREVRVLEI